MSWAYDPIIALCWWIAVIGALIFILLMTYYLYYVQPLYHLYLALKEQVESLKGEINIKIINDETHTWMTPIQAWVYVSRHPLTVTNTPHLS